jgi:hypothetical protein
MRARARAREHGFCPCYSPIDVMLDEYWLGY